jgi:hypothetical protein
MQIKVDAASMWLEAPYRRRTVMRKLPKGRLANLRTGDRTPGLRCKNCGYGIPIESNLASEWFRATRPTCRKTGIYQSGEIQTLMAVVKH